MTKAKSKQKAAAEKAEAKAEAKAEKLAAKAGSGTVVKVHVGRNVDGKVSFEHADVEIPAGEITIAARKDNHRRNGMVFNRKPVTVEAESLGWDDAQWANALGDRLLVISTPGDVDPDEDAPGLTQEEENQLSPGGVGTDGEATEPDTDEPESR